jgi:hypothetical protein
MMVLFYQNLEGVIEGSRFSPGSGEFGIWAHPRPSGDGDRAFHSNLLAAPKVFPFQSLALLKNGIHAIFGHVYHSRPRGAPARLKAGLLLAGINTVTLRRAGVTFFP